MIRHELVTTWRRFRMRFIQGSSCLVLVHNVDKWLSQRHLADTGHVEAVDIVPPLDLVVLVLPVLDAAHIQRGLVREHEAAGREPLVPSVQHRVQHRLVEKMMAGTFAKSYYGRQIVVAGTGTD